MLTAQLELVKIWFSRSGGCPLSLSLTRFPPNSLFLPRFLETAVLHRRRWEYVVLYTPIKHLHLLRGEMSLLRNGGVHPRPQLKRVTLPQYFCKSAITLPWAQLTHFDGPLSRLSGEDEGLEILRDAPHLVTAGFVSSAHTREGDPRSQSFTPICTTLSCWPPTSIQTYAVCLTT
ncbi:hypothetical protein B0H19DRAFT_1248705 [Mycena capillaripes]|nr:hypothetical protein B0H19DRAFT_1248705 [Mycena capillaripes]